MQEKKYIIYVDIWRRNKQDNWNGNKIKRSSEIEEKKNLIYFCDINVYKYKMTN